MWPKDLKIYPFGGDSVTNVNRNSRLLRQIDPIGETMYYPVTSPATNSVQGFLGEIGEKSKFTYSLTVIFDHLVRTPKDRFRNENRDAWSHNDAWTHNQTATKILAFHEINPEGKTKEIDCKDFVNSHNGKLFFVNQEVENDQMEFIENVVAFIGQRLSRYDTEYMLKKALEGDNMVIKKDIEDLELGIQKLEQEKTNRDHTIRSLNDEIANQDEVLNKLNKFMTFEEVFRKDINNDE